VPSGLYLVYSVVSPPGTVSGATAQLNPKRELANSNKWHCKYRNSNLHLLQEVVQVLILLLP
jgi:hypothetical protein